MIQERKIKIEEEWVEEEEEEDEEIKEEESSQFSEVRKEDLEG